MRIFTGLALALYLSVASAADGVIEIMAQKSGSPNRYANGSRSSSSRSIELIIQ